MIHYINRLKFKPNILVVGDVMVDLFSFCLSNKISAEVDIPIAYVINEEMRLGGAANVWNNVHGLNANAFLCGAVGLDTAGKFVKEQIKDCTYIVKQKRTTMKHRYYLNNTQVFRVDSDVICNHFKKAYNRCLEKIFNKNIDAIIISDYLKGFCNEYFIKNLITFANKKNIFIAVDSKFNQISRYANVDLIKINKNEFQVVFNEEFNVKNAQKIREKLKKNNISKLLVTLGKDGMVLITQNNVIKYQSNEINNADVIGAGDCVIACYVIAKLNTFNEQDCLNFAGLCTEYCLQKIGTKNFSINEYKKEMYE